MLIFGILGLILLSAIITVFCHVISCILFIKFNTDLPWKESAEIGILYFLDCFKNK